MKKLLAVVSLGAALCLILSGCSKKEEGGSSTSTSPQALSGPPVELKIKWTVGKKYSQHMEMSQDSKMNMNGKPMEQNMKMASDYSIAAQKALPDGGVTLEMEFVGQKIESAMGGQTMVSFDSASDPANDARNPVAPMLRKIIGMRINYETDANGRVQHVTGFEEMIDKLGGNTPQGMILKQMFSEETLKQYADFSRGLPDHPVRIGETWPLNVDMPMGQMGALVLSLTYTFKGWADHDNHKCAQLDYAGTLSSKPDPKAGISFSIESGTITGTTWFDPELGMVIENASDQNMEMKISPAPNQVINTVVTQKTSLKLASVTDIK